MKTQLLQRIKTDENGCWIYQEGKGSHGYGVYKQRLAHRLAYEEWIGPIPDGMKVLHHCDVRACINPDHLYAGTQKDNIHDAIKRGRFKFRGAGTLCYKGHDNWYTAPGTGKRYCKTCYNINKRGYE